MTSRILGIDPGLTRCGYGIIDADKSRKATLVDVGVIQSQATSELVERIGLICQGVQEQIDAHKPDSIAIERVFSQSNVSTVMGVAQISGAIMLLAYKADIPVSLHTPTAVKAAVTGDGKANKDAVAKMVCRILGLTEIPKPVDATDALALAICHSWSLVLPAASETQTAAQKKWASALAASKPKR